MSPFRGRRGHLGRCQFVCKRRRGLTAAAESQAIVRREVDGREVYPIRSFLFLPRGIRFPADLGANNDDDDRRIHALIKSQ